MVGMRSAFDAVGAGLVALVLGAMGGCARKPGMVDVRDALAATPDDGTADGSSAVPPTRDAAAAVLAPDAAAPDAVAVSATDAAPDTGIATGAPWVDRSWTVCGGQLFGGAQAIGQSSAWTAVAYSAGPLVLYTQLGPKMVTVLSPLEFAIDHVVLSPDGSMLATADSGEIKLWHLPDGVLSATLAQSGPMRTLTFSPSGDLLLMQEQRSDGRAQVVVWKTASDAAGSFVTDPSILAFSHDGVSLLTVTGKTFAIRTFAGVAQQRAQLDLELTKGAFSPDGTMLAGSTSDGSLAAFSLPDGHRLWSLPGSTLGPSFVGVSSDGVWATAHEGGLVSLDWQTGAIRRAITLAGDYAGQSEDPRLMISFAIEPDGRGAYGIDSEGQLLRWSLSDGARSPYIETPPGESGPVATLAASRDGRLLAFGGGARPIWVLKVPQLETVARFLPGEAMGMSMDFSPDGTELAVSGDAAGTFRLSDRVWSGGVDVTSGAGGLSPFWAPTSLRFAPDGGLLACGGYGAKARLFSAKDGTLMKELPSATPSPAVAFSHDGSLLATSGVELWRLSDGRQLWSAPSDSIPSDAASQTMIDRSITFSPDDSRLLVANGVCSDGPVDCPTHVRLLRASDGQLVRDLGAMSPRRPSFSPDGQAVVMGGQLVELETGRMAKLPVSSAVSLWLPDGRIALGRHDGTLQILCPR
jgi:WD40 repeat protein